MNWHHCTDMIDGTPFIECRFMSMRQARRWLRQNFVQSWRDERVYTSVHPTHPELKAVAYLLGSVPGIRAWAFGVPDKWGKPSGRVRVQLVYKDAKGQIVVDPRQRHRPTFAEWCRAHP